MRTAIIILLIFCAAVPAAAEDAREWTTLDTALQTAFVAITLVDWAQTQQSVRNREHYLYVETNPVLGKYPSKGRVNAVIGASILAHTAISYSLPKPWRTVWQSVWIGIETQAVRQNHAVGLGVSLHF